MYPCDPISFKYMKIRGEASYYYAEIKEFVKEFVRSLVALTSFYCLTIYTHMRKSTFLCCHCETLSQSLCPRLTGNWLSVVSSIRIKLCTCSFVDK